MKSPSTSRRLVVDRLPSRTASIDVRFDGVRIWSIDVREITASKGAPRHQEHEFVWPEAIRPYLSGSTRLSVHDSASGDVLSAEEISFDDADVRTTVVDNAGSQLVLNKWGRLGVSLDAMGDTARALIVQRSAALINELQQLGLRPFVVGGTLLGAVRDGTLLPHDDDADIAYLSRHTSPVDVATEAFRVGRQLEKLGYEIKRHSATHMQLLFRDGSGSVLHYIDVFAAFFSADGLMNQPFHVRGDMAEAQMMPFSTVDIDGTPFPAPADQDHWLTINYDTNWRTPIPGYVLETPLETRRRFENWFGAFNFLRDFWDEHFSHRTGSAERAEKADLWRAGHEWLVEQVSAATSEPGGRQIVDLGCGDGTLTRGLARAARDRRVLGLDYSGEALRRATTAAAALENVRYGRINLYRARSLAALGENGVSGAFDVAANHVLDEIGHHGRAYAWRIMRMALRSGGSAHFTFHAQHASGVTIDDPTGWHLSAEQLTEEAVGFGLTLEFTPLAVEESMTDTAPIPLLLSRAESIRRHSRRPTGVTVRLAREAGILTPRRQEARHE